MDLSNYLETYEGKDAWDIDWLEGIEVFKEGLPIREVESKLKDSGIKINKNKLRFLGENGFILETISHSPKFKYPKDYELTKKEARRTVGFILKMQSGSLYQMSNTRKTFSLYGIKYSKEYFQLFNVSFRRKTKKTISKPNFNAIISFLEGSEDFTPSPYSRDIPLEMRELIFKRDNYTCFYCGWRNGIKDIGDRILSIDHIVPWKYGGTSKPENLITSCLECNIKKNDKITESLILNAFKDKQTKQEDKGEVKLTV